MVLATVNMVSRKLIGKITGNDQTPNPQDLKIYVDQKSSRKYT